VGVYPDTHHMVLLHSRCVLASSDVVSFIQAAKAPSLATWVADATALYNLCVRRVVHPLKWRSRFFFSSYFLPLVPVLTLGACHSTVSLTHLSPRLP